METSGNKMPDQHPHDDQWQPMQTAPRDPQKVVRLRVDIESVRAYWDPDLDLWVLVHPLHIESIREPKAWKS